MTYFMYGRWHDRKAAVPAYVDTHVCSESWRCPASRDREYKLKTAAACTLGSSFELASVIVDVEQVLQPLPCLWVFVAVNV